MKNKLLLLIYLVLVCLPAPAKDVYLKHLSSADGISLQSAISIWQDQLGNMWFGNDVLNKYNGNMLNTYRLSDYLDTIKDTNIRQICGDHTSMIYILANTEIVIYDTRLNKFIMPGIEADYICSSVDGKLHYTHKSGLYAYEHKNNTSHRIMEINQPDVSIKSVIFSGDGRIWLGTNNGLFVTHHNQTEHLIDNIYVSCMLEDSKQNIWVGTVSDGIRIVKNETNEIAVFKQEQPLAYNAKLSNNRIRCFCEDDKQNIWIGTYKGITIYTLESNETSTLEHNESVFYSLRHNSVYAIYKDNQGTMWIGSYYGGVSYFNPALALYRFYRTSAVDPSMLSGFIIGNMAEDDTGHLYIATEEGGVNILNPNTGRIDKFDKNNSNLPHNTIKSIWYDDKYRQVYVGTFTEGLWYKTDNSGEFNKIGGTVLSTDVQKVISQIIPYNDEYIIISTQDNVYKVNRKDHELTPLLKAPLLSSDNIGIIQTMFIDPDETLWISSSEKFLFSLNLQTYKTEEFNCPGVDKSVVRQIQQGFDGKIYLLTRSHLLAFNKNTRQFKRLNDNLLFTDNYYHMARLPSGRFIMTADKGITMLNPVSLNAIHLSFADIFPLKSLHASSGLYVSSNNKHIYIGGLGGMLVFKEEDDIETIDDLKNSVHHLFLNSLSINNNVVNTQSSPQILPVDISYAKSIKLNYKQNNISLTFASSNYIYNNSILYEYILEGFDKQWTMTGDKVIRYTSLPPGSYSLTVREMDNHDRNIKLDIHISPPFYSSAWAYIIYTLLLICLLIYILHFTQRNALLKASLKMECREKQHIDLLNKMKINFFTNVSHEFRTPLTLISSQIDIALNNDNLPLSHKKRFLKIKKYTKEMRFLIDELMYFNKLEQGSIPIKVSQEDISSFIHEIYLSFKEYAHARNITFSYEYTNEPLNIWFDRVQMKKVMYNLLSNAFKFTKDNGAIIITLKRKKESAEISVRDTGVGIDTKELDKVFERFYQANQDIPTRWSEGMGIGLSLSKNIVALHHGDILVESKHGEGSCFTVKLLLGNSHFTEEQKGRWPFDETVCFSETQYIEHKSHNTIKELQEEIAKEHSHYKPNILIIEDSEELLELLTEVFSPVYNVTMAEDGEKGLNMAIEMHPDIILSDIMIPSVSGLDICKKLKSRTDTSHIPILLITAYTSFKQNLEGLQYGADDYIVKPFNIELLLLKCNNLVKSRKEQPANHQQTNSTADNEIISTAINAMDQLFLKKAITIAETNLTNADFDISSWAKDLHIGRSKLFQKIKETTGYTPNEYIIILKMKKAAILLKENPCMTVAEIAYQTGFSSPGYFSKSFKEYYGITPLQYRQN